MNSDHFATTPISTSSQTNKDNKKISSLINSKSQKLIYNEIPKSLIILDTLLFLILVYIIIEISYSKNFTSSFIFSIYGIIFFFIYFLIIFVFIIILFLIKHKRICFNKQKRRISIRKSSLFKTVVQKFDVDSIKDIKILLKTRLTEMNDLSSFFIRFTFQDGRKFDFSEETHVELVIFKYRQVKAFLYGEYLSKEEIINKGIEYELAGIDSNSDEW